MFGKLLGHREIKHPLADELYQYVDGKRFDPGAPAEGFLPKFGLPPISFRGRARVAVQYFRALQPAQVYFLPQRGVQGLGGVQTGQVIGQPLLDPSEFEGA